MKIIICEPEEFVPAGASIITERIEATDNSRVILPTGNTVQKIYAELKSIKLRYMQLDEVVGTHIFKNMIFNQVLKPLGITKDAALVFDGKAEDLEKETQRIEKEFSENPAKLSILGLGQNGHIGYNEPGSATDSKTRTVPLTNESISVLKSYGDKDGDNASMGITLGIGTLKKAENTLLLVNYDTGKINAFKKMLSGPIDPKEGGVPAAALREFSNVTILADKRMWEAVEDSVGSYKPIRWMSGNEKIVANP